MEKKYVNWLVLLERSTTKRLLELLKCLSFPVHRHILRVLEKRRMECKLNLNGAVKIVQISIIS